MVTQSASTLEVPSPSVGHADDLEADLCDCHSHLDAVRFQFLLPPSTGRRLGLVKVLFTCVVGVGHLHPMVPLARALQAAGHEVEFATDPDLSQYVASLGFTAHPAGLNHADVLSRYMAINPGLRGIPASERIRYWFGGMFAQIRVPPMLDDLRPILKQGRVDLLIHGSMEMAGGIAAEMFGIPHAEHSVGVMRPTELVSLALAELAPIGRAAGVDNPSLGGSGGELYIALCPPALEDPDIAAVPNVQHLRPIGFDESPGALLPASVGMLPRRPTVYVTLGTVFNEALQIFRTILEGLREADLNIIVTIGKGGEPAALGTLSTNVLVERYIPQSLLLPRCDVVIAHGGSGTMLGAVNAGLPQLAIPQAADQFINAAAIVRAGLGLALGPSEFGPDAVRRCTNKLLDEHYFGDRARQVAAEISSMPMPDDVVQVLEGMI